MAILVLRHDASGHLGYFERVLIDHDISFEYKDLGDPATLDGKSGLIVMGGPQSANESSRAMKAERTLIAEAITHGLPVLGICLGAQLIAKSMGTSVYRNPVQEIGWAPLYFTEQGKRDPLFAGLASPTTVFHWHSDAFDLPTGAEWLAYSEHCRHQAFRVGRNVYGIQFHPEITPAMIADWSSEPAACGEEILEGAIDPHAFDTAPVARRILEAWLGEC